MPAKRSLEERIAQLDARKKSLQSKLARQERARDTRRKVLLGALLMHRMDGENEQARRLRDWVQRELPDFLTRDGDKELFDDLIAANDAAGAHQHDTANDQSMQTLSR